MGKWILQVLIAVDQLVNAVVGGYADETLSSRAHRMRSKGQRYWGWTARLIDTLFFWQPGHCRKAWESEIQRSQLPTPLRQLSAYTASPP